LLEAVAVAVPLQDVDVVGKPVEQSAGEPLGTENQTAPLPGYRIGPFRATIVASLDTRIFGAA
jgi:hypothetical protein